MSFNSYCDTQTPSTEEPSNSPPPSSGGSPSSPDMTCADSGGSVVEAGNVSPTIVVGDVNVGFADTADVLTGGALGGGIHDIADVGDTLNNLDVLDAVADTNTGDILKDTADLSLDALNGGGASSGGSGGSGDPDTGGLICQLVGSLSGAGDGILNIDLADVGAILGDGCLADIPIDGVTDCIIGQSSLLDVAGLGDFLGDHA